MPENIVASLVTRKSLPPLLALMVLRGTRSTSPCLSARRPPDRTGCHQPSHGRAVNALSGHVLADDIGQSAAEVSHEWRDNYYGRQ